MVYYFLLMTYIYQPSNPKVAPIDDLQLIYEAQVNDLVIAKKAINYNLTKG